MVSDLQYVTIILITCYHICNKYGHSIHVETYKHLSELYDADYVEIYTHGLFFNKFFTKDCKSMSMKIEMDLTNDLQDSMEIGQIEKVL